MTRVRRHGRPSSIGNMVSVRDCIHANPGVAGVESLRELLGGRMPPVRAAVNTLLAAGDVVERKAAGRGRGRQLYLAHAAPAEGT